MKVAARAKANRGALNAAEVELSVCVSEPPVASGDDSSGVSSGRKGSSSTIVSVGSTRSSSTRDGAVVSMGFMGTGSSVSGDAVSISIGFMGSGTVVASSGSSTTTSGSCAFGSAGGGTNARLMTEERKRD